MELADGMSHTEIDPVERTITGLVKAGFILYVGIRERIRAWRGTGTPPEVLSRQVSEQTGSRADRSWKEGRDCMLIDGYLFGLDPQR